MINKTKRIFRYLDNTRSIETNGMIQDKKEMGVRINKYRESGLNSETLNLIWGKHITKNKRRNEAKSTFGTGLRYTDIIGYKATSIEKSNTPLPFVSVFSFDETMLYIEEN